MASYTHNFKSCREAGKLRYATINHKCLHFGGTLNTKHSVAQNANISRLSHYHKYRLIAQSGRHHKTKLSALHPRVGRGCYFYTLWRHSGREEASLRRSPGYVLPQLPTGVRPRVMHELRWLFRPRPPPPFRLRPRPRSTRPDAEAARPPPPPLDCGTRMSSVSVHRHNSAARDGHWRPASFTTRAVTQVTTNVAVVASRA